MTVETVTTAVRDHVARAPRLDLYLDYEEGRHAYPYASEAFRRKYEWVLKAARMNACETVRENFSDLVQFAGWSGAGAPAAHNIATTTDLDFALSLTIDEAIRTGDGFILVWPDAHGENRAWAHRSNQVEYTTVPGDPSTLETVTKLWVEGKWGRANVYTAESVERWVTASPVRHSESDNAQWPTQPHGWVPFDGDGEPDVIPHDFGRVPWVHVAWGPKTQGGRGQSILRDVIPLQDNLNHAVHAILVNTEQYAAPLRALLGFTPEKKINPSTGRMEPQHIEIDPAKKNIYVFEGDGAQLMQLDPPDAAKIIAVKQEWFASIANTVGIPVTDIAPDIGNVPSGAALRTLAARRTNKVRNFTKQITGTISQLMSLLGVEDAYPEWVDPAPVDESERLANAQAKIAMGYPLTEVLADLGETPDDIERILAALAAESPLLFTPPTSPEVMGVGG